MAAIQTPLENEAIASILEDHNTNYCTEGGHIYGYTPDASKQGYMKKTDITGCTLTMLLHYLEY